MEREALALDALRVKLLAMKQVQTGRTTRGMAVEEAEQYFTTVGKARHHAHYMHRVREH